MKIKSLFLVLCLMCFSISALAEEAQNASEMPKPMSEPASKGAKKRAHNNVEKSQKELLTKLENHDSPGAISNAKARVQIDRTESNRQDYLNQEMNKPIKKEPSE